MATPRRFCFEKVIRFYENGEKVYSQELEGGEANQFSNIIIGKNRRGGRKYNGNIDDVYVYNRAINDAEVARLFDGGLEDSDGDGLTDSYETGKGRYQAIPGKFSWNEAMKAFESRGGHLATITSEAEWHAIHKELGEVPFRYFLGGTDEKTEGFGNGSQMNFGNSQSLLKDNLTTLKSTKRFGNQEQDYLLTWTQTSNGNRLWDDNHNYSKGDPWINGYILEFGYYTNPNLADSDGDGHDDGKEVAANTAALHETTKQSILQIIITKLTAALQEKTAQLAAHEEKDARRSIPKPTPTIQNWWQKWNRWKPR